jgi:predicted nucleic acid-binding protein
VTRYLLDTNIVSESARRQPSPVIADWLQNQVAADLFIATFTLAEIWRGVRTTPLGRRRLALESWFAGAQGPPALFRERILAFDEAAAIEWGRIIAEGRLAGNPRSPLDMLIAATAVANACVVVTLNQRHFEGVAEFYNPLRPP